MYDDIEKKRKSKTSGGSHLRSPRTGSVTRGDKSAGDKPIETRLMDKYKDQMVQ